MTRFDDRLTALRAMGEPTRFRLLRLLDESELTVTELTAILGQSQPGISRHLRVLSDAGLVVRHQEGAWVFYRAALADGYRRLLGDLTGEPLDEDAEKLAAVQTERAAAAARYFAAQAESWNALRNLHMPTERIEAEIATLCRAIAAGSPLPRVVDLGTGTGRMLVLLKDLYEEGIGYDTSAEMLAVARAEIAAAGATGARVRRGDLFSVSEDDESGEADLVVLHHVLHYLARPQAAVEAAVRLAAGQHVLIADFAPHDREELREAHAHRRLGFSDREIERWAKAAGTRVAAVRTLPPPEDGGLTAKLWLLGPRLRSVLPNSTEAERHAAI